MKLATIKGIYSIRNKENNKRYVGESLDIAIRFKEHKESLKQNKHHSYKLQNDYNKYGVNNFEFEILEVAYQTENLDTIYKLKMHLIYLESLYVKKFNSIDDGYNCEDTLELVLKGDKTINTDKDRYYLKQYIKKQNIINENFEYKDRKYNESKKDNKRLRNKRIYNKNKSKNLYYIEEKIMIYLKNFIKENIDIIFKDDDFATIHRIRDIFNFINTTKIKKTYEKYIDENKNPTVDWIKCDIVYCSESHIEQYRTYTVNKQGLQIILDEVLSNPENPHGIITQKFIQSFNTDKL